MLLASLGFEHLGFCQKVQFLIGTGSKILNFFIGKCLGLYIMVIFLDGPSIVEPRNSYSRY